MVELDSGSISIDGVNIATLGLRQLRTKMSIIPQVGVIPLGTACQNMSG
jgi:ABC-type multidrug transport system fused ATPase/permease subunit